MTDKITLPAALSGREAVVPAADVFRIAGGDVECSPNPSAEQAMDCLRDLRKCYDEALITPQPGDGVVAAILAEVGRATAKFPTWPNDILHAVGVVNEEVGELNKAILQAVYEPHKSTNEDVATEAFQAAAMLHRFIASLPVYDYHRCVQHEQTAAPSAKGVV